MICCTSSNKLNRGKNQWVHQNLDNPKKWTHFGTGLSIGQLSLHPGVSRGSIALTRLFKTLKIVCVYGGLGRHARLRGAGGSPSYTAHWNTIESHEAYSVSPHRISSLLYVGGSNFVQFERFLAKFSFASLWREYRIQIYFILGDIVLTIIIDNYLSLICEG